MNGCIEMNDLNSREFPDTSDYVYQSTEPIQNPIPKCSHPGCTKEPMKKHKRVDGTKNGYRTAKWAKKKYGTKEGYYCSSHESDYLKEKNNVTNLLELTAKRKGLTPTAYVNSCHPYRKHRKTYCENVDGRLGFICTTTIKSTVMLDVDHIDGDPSNNEEDNLQTLCKCCHAYKTNINEDHKTPGRKQLKIQY